MKTKKEMKHEMLLTFVANLKRQEQLHRRRQMKPRLLRNILSLFL